MEHPRIIINAKVYPEVLGPQGARGLAAVCEEAAEEAGTIIGIAPPQVELSFVAGLGLRRLQVFAQHTDPLRPGSGTGWTPAEAVAASGAMGSLVNHAEHKIPHADVATVLARLHAAGLASLVCADSMEETRALAPLGPTYLAVEPPGLIGGDVSVTSSDPAIVEEAAAAVRDLASETLPLCGAGVKTGRDVAKAIELGAHGVLLASGVVKAQRPLMALRDLVSGLP